MLFQKSTLLTARTIIFRCIDVLMIPVTICTAYWMKFIRVYLIRFWSSNAPFTKWILRTVGVFPITSHYYEPYVYKKNGLKKSLREDRYLPGIDLNTSEQLSLLGCFNFNEELLQIADLPNSKFNFSFSNETFLSGDAETAYNIVRYFKPKKIIEVGCGNSTLILQHALEKNRTDSGINFEHICIEPFHYDYLAEMDVQFLKMRVEEVDPDYFKLLKANDILFIDSSHVIRPQGDVLVEYLQILPELNSGVIVHIHDIFTPRDYLDEWLTDGVLFWNEQYLLESFLTLNNSFKILCATNYLAHNYPDNFSKTTPMMAASREPGSFWIQRI